MSRLRFAPLAIQAKLATVARLLDGGWLDLYAGTQPHTPTQPPGATRLARLRFGTPAFHPPQGRVSEAYPLEPEVAAPSAGLVQWFRCSTAEEQPVVDGSVDTSDADLLVSSRRILVGTRVTIQQLSFRSAD